MTFIGDPSQWLGSAASHLNVVDEARLADTRRGEDHELAGLSRRGTQIFRLSDAEVIRAESGALELVEPGTLDVGKIGIPRADARRRGLERNIDLRREGALCGRQVLVARAHGEPIVIADRWGADDLNRHAEIRHHAANHGELLEVL